MSYSRNKNLTRYTVVNGERVYFETATARNAYETMLEASSGNSFELSFDVLAKGTIEPGQALVYYRINADGSNLGVVATTTTGENICGWYSGDTTAQAGDTIKMVTHGKVNMALDSSASDIAKGAPVKWTTAGGATIAESNNTGVTVMATILDTAVKATTAGGTDLYEVFTFGFSKTA